MTNYSSFDIIGPVMVGPSSSHTAGACRLGRLAKALGGDAEKGGYYPAWLVCKNV